MTTLAELLVKVKLDSAEIEKGLSGLQGKLQNIGSGLTSTGKSLTMGVTAPIIAGVATIGKLTNEAIGFEQQMNEVFTLMPGATKKSMGKMSADVLQFAKDMGVIPSEVAPALYQAISAGVPADNVFTFLETANKAAIGGVTDLETAVDGITTVVNSYGAEVMDAGKASDLMFTAVRLGKTTFGELSASLFNVLPSASSLGVSFEEVSAAMSTMTAQGVPTSVATTQMRQLLVELSKEGGKAAGVFQGLAGQSFKDFVAAGGDVSGALAIMTEHANSTGVGVNDLFGSVEAGNAALQLSGENAAMYNAHLGEMQTVVGATDAAFETMEQGVGRQMEKLRAEFAATMIEIGDKFLPVITETLIPIFREQVVPLLEKVAEWLKNVAEWFSNLSPEMQKTVLVAIAIAAALGPVLVVLGMLVSALSVLLSPIGLVVLAIIALIAIGVLLYKNWDKIKEKTVEIWDSVKNYFSQLWEQLKTFFGEWGPWLIAALMGPLGILAKLIYDNWDKIKAFAIEVWGAIKDYFVKNFNETKEFMTKIWESIKTFFSTTWESVKMTAQSVWDAIKAFFTGNFNATKTFIMGIWESIKTFLSAAWNTIKTTALSIWENIKNGVIGKATALKDGIVSTIETALAWIKKIPAQALQWGKDIIQGLINGIRNMAGNLMGALQGVVNSAISSVKSVLGIKSPSKLFKDIGENVVKGFEIGVDGNNVAPNLAGNLVGKALGSPSMLYTHGLATDGRNQTIIVELDGSIIAKAIADPFMDKVRIHSRSAI